MLICWHKGNRPHGQLPSRKKLKYEFTEQNSANLYGNQLNGLTHFLDATYSFVRLFGVFHLQELQIVACVL